jgi:sugar phosphate isomerase/epimerase
MNRLSYILVDRWERSSIAEFATKFAFLRDCGYAGVELNMTAPLLENLSALEECLGESGVVVPSFLTGEGYADGLCLSSPEQSKREAAVSRLLHCVDAAKRLGSIFVVGMLQGTFSDEEDPTIAQERIVAGLEVVAKRAEREGVRFVIEPVNHLQVAFNNSVSQVRALIRQVGSGAIRPMVDTVHMNIEEASLFQPIRDCGKDLGHVHLCESNGGRFGSGHIDFAGVLKTLDKIAYQGFLSVKVYRHLDFKEAAQLSIEYLRQIESQIESQSKTIADRSA